MATTKVAARTVNSGSSAGSGRASRLEQTPSAEQTGSLGPVDEDTLLAEEYLADLVYLALLERGEAAKASEITLEINNPLIPFPLVRRALAESPRFVSVDRQWNLSARYLDTARPTERNLTEVLQAAGRPLSTSQLATELSAVYNRPAEVYLALLQKITGDASRYLRTRIGEIAPRAWLPLVDADDDEDVLFDNDLTPVQMGAFEAGANVSWRDGYAAATRALLEQAKGRPVLHRILGVLAWRDLGSKYNPLQHFLDCFHSPDLVWLSGGRWISRARAQKLEALLAERAEELGGEEVIEEPLPVPAEAPPVEVAPPPAVVPVAEAAVPAPAPVRKPLEVKPEDVEGMEQIAAERQAPVDAVELLALQFEVVAGDPSFRDDLRLLVDALRANARFSYVGAGRFRQPNSLPLFVYTVPESLAYPDLQFVSLEGEIMDEEIEDEGFAGTLRNDILDPLVQDVGDDEGRYTGGQSSGAPLVRLVLKVHHKEIGTFPLCQIPDGFFPGDAPVVEVSIKDPSGTLHNVVVNNELRMAFNLFGLYEMVPHDGGGVFHLERTARPYEYRFASSEEADPQLYLSSVRVGELMALREQAEESGDLATFDIVCEVLAHHNRGLDFAGIMTEVNVVRRVTRRKVASILSNYYCFLQKPGQNLWRFDAKKRDLGTDRAKRKYLKR